MPRYHSERKTSVNRQQTLQDAVVLVVEALERRCLLSAGDPDLTFGTSGLVDTTLPSQNNTGLEHDLLVVHSDDKIVVGGVTEDGFTAARFNPDGTPDTTFDGDGIASIAIPGSFTSVPVIQSVAVQPDGKILLGGYVEEADFSDFLLVRFNSDGSADTDTDTLPGDFGGDGIVTTNFDTVVVGIIATNSADQLHELTVHDGKIVAVGSSENAGGRSLDFALARYNDDGTLDTSFDSDGKVLTNFATTITSPNGTLDQALGVAIQSDDKIVAAGLTTDSVNEVALARYNDDGSLDTGFDSDGKVSTFVGDGFALAVGIQSNGKIVAAGGVAGIGDLDSLLVGYNDDGSLDTGFDGDNDDNGIVSNDFGGDDFASSIAIQSDGKILTGGTNDQSGTADFVLARYTNTGALDSGFGSGGSTITSISSGNDFAHGIGLQSDGKIIAAISADGGNLWLARYEGDTVVVNSPPTAEAGTYPAVDENSTVQLDGSDSTDPDGVGDIVLYEWDLDYDGMTFDAEESGVTVNFTQDLPNTYTVALRVTDSANNTDIDTATVTFNDVAPTADAGADQTVVRQQTVNLSGTGENTAGDAITTYQWDLDNDSVFETSGQNVSTVFTTTGTFTVNFRVIDDDDQTSAADSAVITVEAANVQGNDLYVGGTDGDDDIAVTELIGSTFTVRINGVLVGTFSPTGQIFIFGGDGHDNVRVDADITLPADIYGGSGDDVLRGGGGNDFLFGGIGNDKLHARGANDVALGESGQDLLAGGDGRDILIGGIDADKIAGDADDDILIAGNTSHDADRTALNAIQAEWLSGNDYETRVDNLRNGGGLNGSYVFEADVTVFDDGVRDILTGGQGLDWFLFNADGDNRDKITDLNDAELADDLDFINS